MISIESKTAFLQRIHLFHDLSLADVGIIASLLNEENFAPDEPVFRQGGDADRFYIIYRGAVKIVQAAEKEERQIAELVGGDYFGEQAVMERRRHTASAVATERSILLSIPADQFRMLLKKFPRLHAAVVVASDSRTLARKIHFKWMRPDEVIYFLARKHRVELAKALAPPIIALAVPIFLTFYFFLTLSFLTIFAAGLTFVLAILWGVWNYIDWGNDYYILTNMRVIWLERVIGVYDSRQEAPLSTVLSVGVDTDQAGRLMDYGNVIVRTFTGSIPFTHVPRPFEAAHLIEEQWSRSKRSATQMEKEAMRNELRRKMGLTVSTKPPEPHERESLQSTPTFYKRSILQIIGSNWFNLRLEDSGTITYRKHWFVLWKQTWEPTVLFILLVAGMVARVFTLWNTPGESVIDLNARPPVDSILLILDSTNLGRHLILAAPILKLGIPTLVVLNMADDLRARGGGLDTEALSAQLGAPVVLVSAALGENLESVTAFLKSRPAVPIPTDSGFRTRFARPSSQPGAASCTSPPMTVRMELNCGEAMAPPPEPAWSRTSTRSDPPFPIFPTSRSLATRCFSTRATARTARNSGF